jgi:hypothetical protein
VVVDDAFARPATVASATQGRPVQIVRFARNRGPAAARNAGLARVRTPYVAFVDSDVDPGWLATLRRHLDDRAVALVAPRICGPEAGVGDGWLDRYERARWSAAFALALLAQRRWSAPVAVATAALAIRGAARQLKRSDHPLRAAATLVLEGAVATLWQTAAALTRHYWPAAAAVALVSRRARRALVAAAVGEAVAAWWRIRPDLDPVRYLVAHRLDDAAYGLWLWAGALRARSVAALTPAWRGFGRR